MMSSTWKISVFGIVALMLAFGLTAGDAFAHSDGHFDHPANSSIVQHFTDATLTVTAISSETLDPRLANGNGDGRKDREVNLLAADLGDRLRATEVLDALVFTYTAGRTPAKDKSITITIPSGWTHATKDVDDGVNRDGEVELLVNGVLTRDKLRVTSRSMKFTGSDPAPGTVQFWFKRVTVPVRADTYEFGVISEMTGDKHVNKLNPHLDAHATKLDADTDEPNVDGHGKVGTITLEVTSHEHPADATHQHIDDNGLLDPPGPHSSHSADHTHDTDTKTVVTVEGHTHPFSADFQPHKHDAEDGTVDTSKTGDPDLHTHTDDPFKDTHAHDEDGSLLDADAHGTETGENQHTHDTDKSVADVATSHKHPAGSIMDHAHTIDGRRGIDALTPDGTGHEADANVHNHVSVGGKVALNTHTHDGHKGDHGHPALKDGKDGPDVANRPSSGEHNTDTHYHDSPGGEVAGLPRAILSHKHPEDSDGGFVGHGHDDVLTGQDITGQNITKVDNHGNSHMHVSDGGVITSVGKGHTHEGPGKGYTRTHHHDPTNKEGSENLPKATDQAVVPLSDKDDDHTATAGGHSPFYFRSGGGFDADLAVHTHKGTGGTVTWPEAADTGWDGIAPNRFGEYNIPYHTHDGRGKVVVVTAHEHAKTTDEVISVSIIDHMHQTGTDATTSDLTHPGGEATALDEVAEHFHEKNKITIDVLAHKHQTGSDAEDDGGFQDPAGEGVNALVAIASQHTHDETKTVIAVTAHVHQTGADATTDTGNPLSHPGEDPATDIKVVTAHYHGASEVVEPLVTAHSHTGLLLNADDLRRFGEHTHDTAVSAHKHDDEAEFSVTEVKAHTHTSSSGSVVGVNNHTHPGGDASASVEGVDPTENHLHAILHNNKYAVRVGPVPSGSGTLALSNRGGGGAVTIAPRTAAPYEGNYVVTKGQDLGDLTLTFTASGTMVAGAGIRIQLPDPNPAFPSFYRDNSAPGPPGGGGVRITRGQVTFSTDPFNKDPDGISTDALYLKTTSKLQSGDIFSVRISDVVTNPHGGDPGQDPTDTVEDYAFAASTVSPLVAPTDEDPIEDTDFDEDAAVKKPPTVTITGQHGVGELTLEARDPRDTRHQLKYLPVTQATTDEELGDIVLTYKATQPMGKKSQVEIMIHSAWPNHPYPPADTSDERAGGVFLYPEDGVTFVINGRVLTATLDDGMDVGEELSFTYKKAKAPAQEGSYEFTAKSKAGPHGTLKPLPADKQKKVDVTTGHGSGTISLKRGGTIFTETQKEATLGTLVFTYTAAGRMAKEALVRVTIPQEWTAPSYDNLDSRADGVVKLGGTGKADLEITGGGSSPWYLIAKLSEPMTKNQTLVFTYGNVTAPATPGSYAFTTSATAFPGALDIDDPGAELQSDSPEIGVDQAPDGSGTITVASKDTVAGTEITLPQDTTGAYKVNAGQSLGDLKFTYTATGKMESGASVSITVPSEGGWDQPTYSNTEVSAGVAHGIVDYTVTASLQSALEKGDKITITYKDITAPSSAGRSVFTAQSKSTSTGQLKDLTVGSPTFVVGEVPVGNLVITTADGELLTSRGPGISIGDVTLTFTATWRMNSAAQVIIDIPDGWSPPSEDNGNTTDEEGEVALASGTATHEVRGSKIVATTNAVLARGDTLVFTYKNVTTPSTEQDYEFTTIASISATSTPVAITSQPSVTIRAVVTAIAFQADESFFAGESLSGMVTLWSGTSAANALGAMVVTLSSDSETGSFTAASITIADNMPGAAFTYNDTAASPVVTLTATSDLMGVEAATKIVAVKSGVSKLVVDPTLVKAGSDVTVTATGKAGGGTVKVMDSEGMQVGDTRSLDPDVERQDGDVDYSRTITLPADLADGTYTVTVDIQDLTDNKNIEVLNDQTPPALSGASVTTPGAFMNGAVVTVTATATSDIEGDISVMVMADVSALDDTQMEAIPLTNLMGTDIYTTILTISGTNTAEDGEAKITITATDRIKNSSMTTVTVTLDNVSDDELTRVWVEPTTPYKPGQTAWIKAMGTAGGEASATVNNSESGMMIAQVALEEMEGTPGTYVGGLTIVEDAHPVGSYDVTVTLGNAEAMTVEDALTIVPPGYEFTLDIPAGRSMIHIPLAAAQVNGVDMEINTVRDVFNALGDAVGFITTLADDGVTFNSYLGDDAPGSAFGDTAIGDDTGLIVNMTSAMTLALKGDALGSGGSATMNLRSGLNLVGVPVQTGILPTLSAAINHPVFAGITHIVIMDDNGQFQNVVAGTATDGPLMGGTGYFVIASAALALPVSGVAWENDGGSGSSAAPVVLNASTTSVLHVQGRLIDEVGMMSLDGLNVSVRNLARGVVLGSTVATDDYSMTFVKLDSSAAKVGDILEIKADSANPLLGIRPVRHVVTVDDVLDNRISLPDLVTYEIPAQTELLANYPNPFNPETWIPFHLAVDASVSVTIYGASGSLVRTIDVGFTPAAVYVGRSDAIYWDGRNNFGEQVSSGIYFYHLHAGDFSATRKMVIVK